MKDVSVSLLSYFNFITVFLNITPYTFTKAVEHDLFFAAHIHLILALATDTCCFTEIISLMAYHQFIMNQAIWKHFAVCILAVFVRSVL
jgi:hypothetical protein